MRRTRSTSFLLHILSFLYSVFKVHLRWARPRFSLYVSARCIRGSSHCYFWLLCATGACVLALASAAGTDSFICTYFYRGLLGAAVVGSNGLEPSTSRLSGVRSNHLSYEPISVAVRAFSANLFRSLPCGADRGGDEQNRTVDPLLARQVLSQLSYTPIFQVCPRLSVFPPLKVL